VSSVPTSRVYISRNVIFNESNFPFALPSVTSPMQEPSLTSPFICPRLKVTQTASCTVTEQPAQPTPLTPVSTSSSSPTRGLLNTHEQSASSHLP
jgi:hypothetical protein